MDKILLKITKRGFLYKFMKVLPKVLLALSYATFLCVIVLLIIGILITITQNQMPMFNFIVILVLFFAVLAVLIFIGSKILKKIPKDYKHAVIISCCDTLISFGPLMVMGAAFLIMGIAVIVLLPFVLWLFSFILRIL